MAVRERKFPLPGRPVSVTNGTRVVTFDTPADFADWLGRIGGACNLAAWEWVDGLVVSDN
jgi:hypothetical protein